MEVHYVHTRSTTIASGRTQGALGMFYEVGADYVWPKLFDGQLPAKPGTCRRLCWNSVLHFTGPLNFKGLYESNLLTKYWKHLGGLTSPDCGESVD